MGANLCCTEAAPPKESVDIGLTCGEEKGKVLAETSATQDLQQFVGTWETSEGRYEIGVADSPVGLSLSETITPEIVLVGTLRRKGDWMETNIVNQDAGVLLRRKEAQLEAMSAIVDLTAPRAAQEPSVMGVAGAEAPIGQAAGQPPSAAQPQTVGAADAGEARPREALALPAITAWRLPVDAGKLPAYVEKGFRLKAMALLCAQLSVVLGIMVACSLLSIGTQWMQANPTALFGFINITIVALMLFSHCNALYPANYVLFVIVTLLAGCVWGLGGHLLPDHMHFQVMGIIAATVLVATMSMMVLARLRWPGHRLVVISVLIGWVVAASVDALLVPMLGMPQQSVAVSIFVALALFLVFLWQAGPLLVVCNPDSFVDAIVAMDASLLVVVSLPFVWATGFCFLLSCCITEGREESHAQGEEAV